jgi:hypothetical protein
MHIASFVNSVAVFLLLTGCSHLSEDIRHAVGPCRDRSANAAVIVQTTDSRAVFCQQDCTVVAGMDLWADDEWPRDHAEWLLEEAINRGRRMWRIDLKNEVLVEMCFSRSADASSPSANELDAES